MNYVDVSIPYPRTMVVTNSAEWVTTPNEGETILVAVVLVRAVHITRIKMETLFVLTLTVNMVKTVLVHLQKDQIDKVKEVMMALQYSKNKNSF